MASELLFKEIKKQNGDKVSELLKTQRSSIDINEINSKTKNGFLHQAIQKQDDQILQALLSASIDSNPLDLNLQDNEQNTPLSLACSLGYLEGVTLLLKEKNIEVNYQLDRDDGKTAFHLACQTPNNFEVVKLLQKRGGDINSYSRSLGSPFLISIVEGDFETSSFLMKNKKIDLFLKDEKENTYLHKAVEAGQGDILIELLKEFEQKIKEKALKGDDVSQFLNSRNNLGNSIFHQCVLSNRLGMIKLLKSEAVKLGLDENLRNLQNKTADELLLEIEEKKKNAEKDQAQKKAQIKIEKTALKQEIKRKEIEEQQIEEQKQIEEEETIKLKSQESKVWKNIKSLFIFLLILAMLAVGVIFVLEIRKKIAIKSSIPNQQRTDYDDF